MQLVPVYEMPFTTVFLMFIIFSFVGWISEVIYVGIISEHKFVNRGFLFGPICPIYGFGGLVILLLPSALYDTWIPLFFASAILCSAVEYFASWILEKVFHTLWWDYSHYKINLNGRICLLNSFLFGLMGLLAIHFAIPPVLAFINWMGESVCKILTAILLTLLSMDIMFTIRRLVDFNTTMEKLHTFADSLKESYGKEVWFRSKSIEEMLASIKEHAEIEKDKFTDSILNKIDSISHLHNGIEGLVNKFPTLKSKKYQEEVKHLRLIFKNRGKKSKNL